MSYEPEFILNNIIFPCSRGSYLISERPALEGVHAALCAKEISALLNKKIIILEIYNRENFETHDEGKNLVVSWAKARSLDFDLEIDVSVGVADVLVYGDDFGIFEIGTTRPTKILLLIKYLTKERHPITLHFWPYGINKAFVFKNWK